LGIEQRGFDTGFGEGIALGNLVQALHGGVDIGRRLAHQHRRQMRIDIGLDAFRAFVAIRETANGGGFADAFDTVAAPQAHNHQGLLAHGVHRQGVGADGRQVDDLGGQTFNQDGVHGNCPFCQGGQPRSPPPTGRVTPVI